MSFLDTKHKKKSFSVTVVLLFLLTLIMFYAGMTRFDPPIENGNISVNLGYTDNGSGDVQPLEKIKTAPQPSEPVPQEVVEDQVEEVLTNDAEDAPVIPTEKKPEKKPVEDVKPKTEEPKKEVKPEVKKPSQASTNALNSLLNGAENNGTSTQSEGNGTGAGDMGQPDGDPYATSYYGGPGSGDGGRGWGLKGRGKPTYSKIKQDCNESGTVVVKIVVNRDGSVLEATPGVRGTTNNAPCLMQPAKEMAKTYKWPRDDKAPAQQVGFIVVKFDLGE